MSNDEPGRWLDDLELGDELRDVLESAALDEPSPAEIDALEASLGPLLDPPPGEGGGGDGGGGQLHSHAPGGVSGAIGLGLAALAAVVMLVGGFTLRAGRGVRDDAPPPVETSPAPEVASGAAAVEPATRVAAVEATAIGEVEGPLAEVRAADPVVDVVGDVEGEGASAGAATPPARREVTLTPNDLVAEARLLGEMRTATPAEVLALARRHEREHPRGELVQEREVLVVEALTTLGRREAAERRARRFETRYPGSGHLGRVRAAVGATAE